MIRLPVILPLILLILVLIGAMILFIRFGLHTANTRLQLRQQRARSRDAESAINTVAESLRQLLDDPECTPAVRSQVELALMHLANWQRRLAPAGKD